MVRAYDGHQGKPLASNHVEDFYQDGQDYEDDLNRAEEIAEETDNDALLDCVQTLQKSWEEYGMKAYLSYRQHDWIKREIEKHD